MGITARNEHGPVRPSSAMQVGSVCPLLLCSFVWTDCMAPLLCSLPSSRRGWGSSCASREYGLLDLPAVAARLTLPPDAQTTHPESGAQRALFDCPDLALLPCGPHVRLIVATHPATSTAKPPMASYEQEPCMSCFSPRHH